MEDLNKTVRQTLRQRNIINRLQYERDLEQRRKSVVQILLEQGVITRERYEQAVTAHTETDQPWDEVIENLGLAQPRQVMEAKAIQLGVPFVDLTEVAPSEDAIAVLKDHVCWRYNSIPVRRYDDWLLVAMVNPNDLVAIDDIAAWSGLVVQPALAAQEEVEAAITRYYLETMQSSLLQSRLVCLDWTCREE